MPGPFPGVDPYLEAQGLWPDFHATFLNYWREAIGDLLPDDYDVRVEERVRLIDVEADEAYQIRPDLSIAHAPPAGSSPSTTGAAVLEPETIPTVIFDEDRAHYLKILHRPSRKLVTVLELLSPTNKVGSGHNDYIARRNAVLRQEVHLVEVDLLTAGHRVPMQRPLPPGEFFAIVARWEQRPDCQVYSWTLRHRLPTIPVPLKAPDPDLMVDLAAVYATAFDRGRYARAVSYGAPLDLPVPDDDRRWAEARAREAAG
jgi:hypothetical protein